jgi:DNA-binding transcriptional MerR regulator
MDKIRRYFSSKEVLRLTDATYRQLDTWIREDIVRVSGTPAAGKGSRRLFTFLDIAEIRIVVSFTRNGVKLSMLKETVKNLRIYLNNVPKDYVWTDTKLITDGRRIFKFVSSEELLESLDCLILKTDTRKNQRCSRYMQMDSMVKIFIRSSKYVDEK